MLLRLEQELRGICSAQRLFEEGSGRPCTREEHPSAIVGPHRGFFESRIKGQPREPRLGQLHDPEILIGCCPVGLLDHDSPRFARPERQPAVPTWFARGAEDFASTVEPRELAVFIRPSEDEDTVGRGREEGRVQKRANGLGDADGIAGKLQSPRIERLREQSAVAWSVCPARSPAMWRRASRRSSSWTSGIS